MEKKTKTLELCEWCAAVVGDAYPRRQISKYRTVECEYCGKKRQGGTYEIEIGPPGRYEPAKPEKLSEEEQAWLDKTGYTR